MKSVFSFIVFLILGIAVLAQGKKVAVIGGGIAGLSAAYYLNQADHSAQIVLFEKKAELGGNAQTKTVTNLKGEQVHIDIGPQYFADQTWEKYVAFLKELKLYDPKQIASMNGSFIIQNYENQSTVFVTPSKGSLRGEKLSALWKFRNFTMQAWKAYKQQEKWKGVKMEDWVSQLKFDKPFEDQMIYPFLASALGTTTHEIKNTSVIQVIQLFAFRKPKLSNQFNILRNGMGATLKAVGEIISSQVQIKTSCPVLSVQKTDGGFIVNYEKDGQREHSFFDYVIIATHADHAANLLAENKEFAPLASILKDLPYFKVRIVLHKDAHFVSSSKPSFLNILVNEKNEIKCNTMNLGQIVPEYQGLYKSWMSDEDLQKVKEKGLLLDETTFYHPMITVDFMKNIDRLNESLKTIPNLSIIGGWSQGLETQNSAIISAQKAVEKYLQFKH